MASPMLVEEESFEWDMGDNFGFYEDLEDDDDDFGRGGGDGDGSYGYESCSSSTAVAIIPSSPATPSSPLLSNNVDNIIHDIHPETLQTTPPILSSSLATKISEELPWSMQHEDMKWIRIFDSSRDGCAFGTFMRSVRNVSHTVIVARTSSGKVVGGYATDVWSGRKVVAAPTTTTATSSSSSHAFLFVVEQPAAAATINGDVKTTPIAAAVESPSHSQQKRQAHQNYNKRFIPGLEEIASSPTSPLEFDFDLETLNAKKKKSSMRIPKEQEGNNIIKVKSDEPQVHIFKPSPRKHPQHQQGGGHYCHHSSSSLKQVCQLGNKFISLGDEYDDHDENHCLKLTIENSFSRGGITTTSSTTTTTSSFKNKNGSGCISSTEEFDIVDFEVYYLSDD